MTNRRKVRPYFRSSLDNTPLDDDAELSDVIDKYNSLIEHLDFLSKTLSLESNFDGYITEVKIPASSTLRVQHFLGVIPKYRIILRQTGNGVITDVADSASWNTEFITLQNNGAVEVTATVMIVRE